ncbi:type I restriction-modification system restriction subunit domain protein [Mycobacterium ulcerans str. Harvey]|uniref:Type I restriction-modification system restriction subunit domain protein n=1 Tax=Mycobacterium ulcerans str. Harvey TaxID=1299332 RepID=A0ABN0R9K1_MYCUL|nr:type I restriction-modification system restriction subunit domain protein [Mycobacterium ulcerans str. Harvey]
MDKLLTGLTHRVRPTYTSTRRCAITVCSSDLPRQSSRR